MRVSTETPAKTGVFDECVASFRADKLALLQITRRDDFKLAVSAEDDEHGRLDCHSLSRLYCLSMGMHDLDGPRDPELSERHCRVETCT